MVEGTSAEQSTAKEICSTESADRDELLRKTQVDHMDLVNGGMRRAIG